MGAAEEVSDVAPHTRPETSAHAYHHICHVLYSTCAVCVCCLSAPMDALDWMATHTISSDVDYPMRGPSDAVPVPACQKPKQPNYGSLQSFGWDHAVPPCTVEPCRGQQALEIELLYILLEAESIPIVYVDSTNWQHYSSGLFPLSECQSTLEAGNHVVELTGVGTDAVTGVPYWIARNSWGQLQRTTHIVRTSATSVQRPGRSTHEGGGCFLHDDRPAMG
jgi:hypothetical protein